MRLSIALRAAALGAALVLLVTSCAGSGGSRRGSDTGSGDSSSVSDTTPADEGSGPETPQSSQNSSPSISVPSLPIGGDAGDDGQAQRCIQVSWTGPPNQVPDQVSVSVDSISVTPDGIFRVDDQACGGDPACGSAWHWTSTSGQCSVSVTQTDNTSSAQVRLELTGTAACSEQSVCADLAAQVGGDTSHSQITFNATCGVVTGDTSGCSNSLVATGRIGR